MGFVRVELVRVVTHDVALAGLVVDLQNKAVECVCVCVDRDDLSETQRRAIEIRPPIFWHSHWNPVRLSAHSQAYGNTGDSIRVWAWRSVASKKAKPNAERRRFSMSYGSIIPY